MKNLFLLMLLAFGLVACADNTSSAQQDETTAGDSTAVEDTEMVTQLPVQNDLEEAQARLQERLSELRMELDSAAVARQAELEGMIRKLEAREKQVAQNLRKFETGMAGDAEELEKRFRALIEDVEEDLKLVE